MLRQNYNDEQLMTVAATLIKEVLYLNRNEPHFETLMTLL